MNKELLKDFFEKHIKGTAEKALVADQKMLLCKITLAVSEGIEIHNKMRNVHITTRCLKHLYDRKPAEEFQFLIEYLYQITRYPDKIYKNKNSKRGKFCFVKKIKDFEYLCSIETITIPPAILGVAQLGVCQLGSKEEITEIQIATVFRNRDNKYLKNYTLLWDWGNGNPHRSALDTPEESTSAPQ